MMSISFSLRAVLDAGEIRRTLSRGGMVKVRYNVQVLFHRGRYTKV